MDSEASVAGIILATSAKWLTELCLPICKKVAEHWTESAQQALSGASQTYCDSLRRRYGTIKPLGASHPFDLTQIYTDVRLGDPEHLRRISTPEELTRYLEMQGTRSLSRNPQKTMGGFDAANKYAFLNVLGQPGAGKSTLLKRYALDCLNPNSERGLEHKQIPLFIELKAVRYRKCSVFRLIVDELENAGFPHPKEFTERGLKDGAMLLLFDGLDEVPLEYLDDVISDIRDLVDKYNQCRFITSCRTAFYKHYFTQFTDVTLVEFDDDQVRSFSRNWFAKESDIESKTSNDFWHLISSPGQEATLELARTPLLLTFICLVFNKKMTLPLNRYSLYKKALEILLEEWAAEKRILYESSYSGLHPEIETLMLQNIAAFSFMKSKLFFSKDYIIKQIHSFLEAELNAPKDVDASKILSAIEVQQGLLVERAYGVYSFSHLTVHEFLAGSYFRRVGQLTDIAIKHWSSAKWREVILLGIGGDNADQIICEISERLSQTFLKNAYLKRLISWSKRHVRRDENASRTLTLRLIGMWSIHSLMRAFKGQGDSNSEISGLALLLRENENNYHGLADPLLRSLGELSHEPYNLNEGALEDTITRAQMFRELRDFLGSIPSDFTRGKDSLHAIAAKLLYPKRWGDPTPEPLREKGLSIRQNAIFQTLKYLGWKTLPELSDQNILSFDQMMNDIELIVVAKRETTSISREAWHRACETLI